MCETDETFRDSYVHGLCRDGIGAVSPSACRGGGDEGGDGAVWGCVFTGTVPGRFRNGMQIDVVGVTGLY